MRSSPSDVIDTILRVARTERVIELRQQKPELSTQMQDYYDAIFAPTPDSAAAFAVQDRLLVAIRTASHTRSFAVVDWYSDLAGENGVSVEQIDFAKNSSFPWPGDDSRSAVMRHVDLITANPVKSEEADIEALLNVGLSPQSVVVLSQIVAYVSYQVRLIASLRALGE